MFHENSEKPGVRALARLAFGELFALCQLNVVFLLTCLPVVTIGPAWTALTRATLNMVRQRSSHPVREYWQALRENFRGGLGLGLLLGGAAAAAGAACLVYARLAPGQPLFWLLLVVAAALATEVLLVSTYAFPLLAGVQLPFRAVLWDALLLTLACPHHAIPAAAGAVALGLVCAIGFPFTVPLVVLVAGSLCNLILTYAAWQDIQRLILPQTEAEK